MKYQIITCLSLLALAASSPMLPPTGEADTWRAVTETKGHAEIIDYNQSLADCMETLAQVEKSRPVIEVTFCERETRGGIS